MLEARDLEGKPIRRPTNIRHSGLTVVNFADKTQEEIKGLCQMHINDFERVNPEYKFSKMYPDVVQDTPNLDIVFKFIIIKKKK